MPATTETVVGTFAVASTSANAKVWGSSESSSPTEK